jgi:hypothetical protein
MKQTTVFAKKELLAHAVIAFTLIITFGTILLSVMAIQPDGGTITYISNTTKNATPPGGRTDEKGKIHTIDVDTTQQDGNWKAYVGNVTGRLVLADGSNYKIYEWVFSGSPLGEIYVSRNDTVSWANVRCANVSNKETEDIALNHTSTSSDSINQTFFNQTHKSFWIGDIKEISTSSCYAIRPFVNDTAQSVSTGSKFQEVLLHDNTNMVYAAILEQDIQGYRNDGVTPYDFQLILPDKTVTGTSTYYFYIEIST